MSTMLDKMLTQTKQIDRVDFTVLGNDEIKKMTSIKEDQGIQLIDLYENNVPKKGGLIDPRLGTTSNIDCTTCGLNSNQCVGHFGHIELVEPMYHIENLKYVHKILSCVCIVCSKLLIYKNENDINRIVKTKGGINRLNEIRALTKNVKICQQEYYGCGSPVPKIETVIEKKTGKILIMIEYMTKEDQSEVNKKPIKTVLTPQQVYYILTRISDDTCKILGLDPKKTRPEDMIYRIFPVPPIQVRPSVNADFMSSSIKEDDLTRKLGSIVKINSWLMKHMSGNREQKKWEEYLYLLQYHLATYLNNETLNVPKSEANGKKTKSLAERLKGKQGRFRTNLMGKRVDFSARTVITSDPTISINEVRVPVEIAKNLTIPEVVTKNNIAHCAKLVQNGRDKYPGANFVFISGNTLPIDLRYSSRKINLKVGDVIERHLVDGDYVLLNRQPSLHKLSMMGHKVKVVDNPDINTFGISVTIVAPYNADFDGDEMNIFVPQTVQGQIELKEIADVKRQLINPGRSKTSIGITQDGLIGSYNLTSPSTKMDWKTFMNILSYNILDKTKFSKIEKNKEYTGNELITYILPEITLIKGNSFKITNGIFETGQLSKDTLGNSKKQTIHSIIWNEYGVDPTQIFLDNMQKITNNFNMYWGFTVGMQDIYMTEDIEKSMKTIFHTIDKKIEFMLSDHENNPEQISKSLLERKILSDLNVIRNDVSKIIFNKLDPTNNFLIMSSSGAKGDLDNIGQIMGCIGMQAFEGNLIPKKYNSRTLPYFFQNDDRSESRGMIKQSFVDGMTYSSFVYHAMTSRENLIQGAVKTADSGYIQRKLVKSMEDTHIRYDNTVRTASNSIIQFIYGDTGADTTKQYEYKIEFVEMNNTEIKNRYILKEDDLTKTDFTKKDNDKLYNTIITLRDTLRKTHMKSRIDFKVINSTYMLPVNFTSIINNVRNSKELNSKGDKLSAKYIIDKLNSLIQNEETRLMCISKNDTFKIKDSLVSKTTFIAALYDTLSPNRCIMEYKFNKKQFDETINKIRQSYNRNMVEPGEMVGMIGAQSMGEPVTQMNLKAFHTSGIAVISNTTMGVPRIKELISVTKTIKTPQMIIYLDKDNANKKMANHIASKLEHTILNDIRKAITVYWDPEPNKENSIGARDNVKQPFYPNKTSKHSCQSTITNLPWLIRIELDKVKMYEKEVTVLDIKSKFCNFWDKRYTELKSSKKDDKNILDKISRLAILSNTDNDVFPVIHIRFDMTEYSKKHIENFIDSIIEKFKLKGLTSIKQIDTIVEELVLDDDNENKTIEKKKHPVIYTKGINMEDIRYIIGIDQYRTMCNDFNQIFKYYGIEAARTILIREFSYAFERGGNEVNYHHLSLLVDQMTFTGHILSIDRHGMSKSDKSPFTRATFEKSTEHMINAAIFGESDNMNGVSSRIMTGQVMKGGTGLCNIVLDTDFIEQSEHNKNHTTYTNKVIVNKENTTVAVPKNIFIPE